jgi:hypothetical protein
VVSRKRPWEALHSGANGTQSGKKVSRPVASSCDPTAGKHWRLYVMATSQITYLILVFGLELNHLLQREAEMPVLPGIIPRVIHERLFEVETRGLSEVGIC